MERTVGGMDVVAIITFSMRRLITAIIAISSTSLISKTDVAILNTVIFNFGLDWATVSIAITDS